MPAQEYYFDARFRQNVQFDGLITGMTRAKIQQEALVSYPIKMADWRIFDDISILLPPYAATGGRFAVTIPWSASDIASDRCNFIAGRDWKVVGITGRVEVAGTGGACTLVVKKVASATDIASGTALHSGSFNLVGTVDTNQTLTLSTTETDLDIAAGSTIGIDVTGTATSAVGSVTIHLVPGSPDDLMIAGGVFGTGSVYVTAGDCRTSTRTRRARFEVHVPHTYDPTQDFRISFNAGMITTVADGSCTIDCEAYKKHTTTSPATTLGTADLIGDAAQSINEDTTFNSVAFNLTAAGLASLLPGDILDCRVTIAVVDTATVGAVIPAINFAEVLADSRG